MIKISPFIKITSQDKRVLQDNVTRFEYVYSEEEDDVCELTLESGNPKLADDPAFSEGRSLTVTWGYIDSSFLVNSRKVYIFDTRCEYTEQGVRLTLICHEKFAITKTDTAKNKNINNNNDSKNITKILLSTEVLENLNITDENQKSVYKMLDAATRGNTSKMDPRQKALTAESQASYAKSNNSVDPANRDNNIPSPNRDAPYSPRLSKVEQGLMITLFNGSNSTYRALKDYFDKQPGGPYIIDSRDDNVVIRTRDFTSEAIREYIYKGEDGELLTFTPETHNRSKAKTSEAINVVSWDSTSKKAVAQKAKKEVTDPSPVHLVWNASPVPYSPEWLQMKQAERTGTRVRLLDSRGLTPNDWPRKPKAQELQNQTFDKHQTNDGRIVYSESLITNNDVEKVGAFGTRNGVDTTLPNYLQYEKQQPEKGPTKTIVRASDNPANARAFADNRRVNDELDTNPATALMVGNPLLESGKQIKVTNVATRHSGNYYIKSVRHTIDHQGYLTNVESMVRSTGATKSTSTRNTSGKARKEMVTTTPQLDKANQNIYDRMKEEFSPIGTLDDILNKKTQGSKKITVKEQYNATKRLKTLKLKEDE